ncbi:SRPBCC family protein [Zavarzinia compransoris]|uniref:SRPBCC family protein n=1 Tax=Zavarzinia marina TaxID=2911065 RepID=UPI001F4134A1|nr:SRPBCC family protein [Zavarzinia marina]MCF4164375.1 SRPBCC family protein [Zavarzinia marina]
MARNAMHFDTVFRAPRADVFALCASHEGMGGMFPGRTYCVRKSDDPDWPEGLGSVRHVKMGPFPPVEETVTVFQPHERYEYRVTGGGPIHNHVGIMRFSDVPDGTRLEYTITFDGRVPFTGWLIQQAIYPMFAKAFVNLHKALDRPA